MKRDFENVRNDSIFGVGMQPVKVRTKLSVHMGNPIDPLKEDSRFCRQIVQLTPS